MPVPQDIVGRSESSFLRFSLADTLAATRSRHATFRVTGSLRKTLYRPGANTVCCDRALACVCNRTACDYVAAGKPGRAGIPQRCSARHDKPWPRMRSGCTSLGAPDACRCRHRRSTQTQLCVFTQRTMGPRSSLLRKIGDTAPVLSSSKISLASVSRVPGAVAE